jgi:hypothetical protein
VQELIELYVLFLLIYLAECFEWVPRQAIGLVQVLGRWRWRPAITLNDAWKHGLLIGEPWPPLSSLLVTEELPLSMDARGVRADGEAGACFDWQDLSQVRVVGTTLENDGRRLARLSSRRAAEQLAAGLRSIAARPIGQRPAAIEELLDARFDVQRPAETVARWRQNTRYARAAAVVLWLGLFVGFPVVMFTPLYRFLPVFAVAVLVLWVASAIAFERVLRGGGWLKQGHGPDLSKRLVAAGSPVAAVRALDHLFRELVGDCDPLAVGAALLPAPTLAAMGRLRLVELRCRPVPEPLVTVRAPGPADLGWWRNQNLQRVEVLLRRAGVDPEALLAPPPPERPESAWWCPSCLAQFVAGAPERCPDLRCGGLPLRPL